MIYSILALKNNMLNVSKFAILVFSIKLFNLNFSNASSCKLSNVGTVLFKKNNLRNIDCWSREEIALLYSRRIFQELLPRKIPNSASLHNYLMLCLDTIRDMTTNDYSFGMMVIVFADVFGGFLQTYGLPFLKEAYYEGFVDYSIAKKLYNVQDDFKKWLRTNGGTWAQRIKTDQINEVLPLTINKLSDGSACSKLVMSNNSSPKQTNEINNSSLGISIPLPVLDSYQKPSAIAVPLKKHALYNLQEESSYDIIVTYFSIVSECYIETTKTDNNLMDQSLFDQMFYDWLKVNILPHLNDETWYVGFSSVLRLEETIKKKEENFYLDCNNVKLDLVKTNSEVKNESEFITSIYIITVCIMILSICMLGLIYRMFHNECCFNGDEENSTDSFDTSESTSLITDRSTSKASTYLSKKPAEWTCKYKNQCDFKVNTSRSDGNPASSKQSSRLISASNKIRKNRMYLNNPVCDSKGCRK